MITLIDAVAQDQYLNKAFILTTGPFQGGHLTLLSTVSVEPPETVMVGIEAELNLGRMAFDSSTVLYVLAAPGAMRLVGLHDLLGEKFLGHIIVFDSRKPETFREVRSIFEASRVYAPDKILIAATHTDAPNGWALEDLQIALRGLLPVACDVTNIPSIKNTFLTLFETSPFYNPLADCVKDYLSAI